MVTKVEKVEKAPALEVTAFAKRLSDGVEVGPAAIREGLQRMFSIDDHPGIFLYVRAPKKEDVKPGKDEVFAKFGEKDSVGIFTRAQAVEKVLRKVLS